MEATKKWYQSSGVWGSLIVMACMFLRMFGKPEVADAVEGEQSSITAIIASIGTMVGAVIALYGRVTASAKIGTGND